MAERKSTLVQKRHIQAGIKKYEGRIDSVLQALIEHSALKYTPYRFQDGRYLLVYEGELYGLLFPDRQAVDQFLEEDGRGE